MAIQEIIEKDHGGIPEPNASGRIRRLFRTAFQSRVTGKRE
jgi:hypothetical protein